ncbi:uncharacterized protein ARMOST_10143 [Armillaria ostoyae]|uniref:Uncharacterized protein n=1 Tax=Armillaria ostoyae TaxID=47428 RepID=A0A284RDG2_ARMOS|nr:uncharacterized protein ARMOST_10143 [Armillaria ostoyae]
MSLCPGYHQVTQFGPDDDYEIFYVTLELGNVEPSLIPSSSWDGAQGSARDVGYGTVVFRCNTLLNTQYPTCRAHGNVSTSEKCDSKRRTAKTKAAACSLVLDRITGKLAPLPRRRRTQKMEVVPEDY